VADLSPILVQVKLEADKLKADLDATSSKLKNFGSTAKDQGTHVSALGQHLKGLVAGFVGFAAVEKSIDFLKESGKAAVEDAKSQGLLELQLKNTTGATKEQSAAVEESIRAMSNQYGVLDDKIRPAYAAIVRVTKDTTEATKLTDLAMNVAAGTGKSLTAVSMALAKAHEGQMGALTRLLPSVKGMKDPFAELATQFAGAGEKAANLDPYQRLQVALDHIKESVGTAIVPIINTLADVLTKAAPYVEKFMNAFNKLGKGDTSGITAIFNNINKAITDFISGGGLVKFVEGFAKSKDQIINAIAQILPKVIQVIVAMIPTLLESAIGLFMSLVNAVVKVLPKLITTFTEVVLPQLIQTVVSLIPILIPAAIKLFLGIVTGLTKALPQIINAVVKLIPVIIKELIAAIPLLVNAGLQLIMGLVKGILDNGPRLIGNAMKTIGDSMVNGFKNLLGIKSPSTVFHEIGTNVGQGLANGLYASTPWAEAAIQKMSAKIVGSAEEMLNQVMDLQAQAISIAGGEGTLSALVYAYQQTGLGPQSSLVAAQNAMANQVTVGGMDVTALIAQAQAAAQSSTGGYDLYVNPTTGAVSRVQGGLTSSELNGIGLGANQGFIQVNLNANTNATPASIAQAVVDGIKFNAVTGSALGGSI
jgi:hypothetical protein